MQSVPTDREEPSGNPLTGSQYSARPSHSEATNSVLLRDAGGRPHGDSSPGPSMARDPAAVQNEVIDNTAQLPPPGLIRHSAESQSSSRHGMPSSPSAEHDQTAPNAGGDAIGNGPDPRGSRLHDPLPRTWFGPKKSEQGVHRLRK
jgi:hypothetical protein